MAFSIADIIKQQVNSAAGGVQIPANVQNQVLGGLSDSILGSLTQPHSLQYRSSSSGVESISSPISLPVRLQPQRAL